MGSDSSRQQCCQSIAHICANIAHSMRCSGRRSSRRAVTSGGDRNRNRVMRSISTTTAIRPHHQPRDAIGDDVERRDRRRSTRCVSSRRRDVNGGDSSERRDELLLRSRAVTSRSRCQLLTRCRSRVTHASATAADTRSARAVLCCSTSIGVDVSESTGTIPVVADARKLIAGSDGTLVTTS